MRRRWAHQHVHSILILMHNAGAGVSHRHICVWFRQMWLHPAHPQALYLFFLYLPIFASLFTPVPTPPCCLRESQAVLFLCSHCKLPVCMNDSVLPAATWPTSKVPPLLCSGATSKVAGRHIEVVGWWISNVELGEGKEIREEHRTLCRALNLFLRAIFWSDIVAEILGGECVLFISCFGTE